MRLIIKDGQAIRLARQSAIEAGETITRAAGEALRERLQALLGANEGCPLANLCWNTVAVAEII
jgi:hypothetical protein